MKILSLNFLLIILSMFILSNCQNSSMPATSNLPTAVSPLAQNTIVKPPTPEQPTPGKATIMGRIVERTDGEPITNISVRLAQVYKQDNEEIFVLDDAFSPGDITDDRGWFVIKDVEAQTYVIVVGDANSAYEIISKSPGTARVWELPPDEVTDVGTLKVNLRP